MLGENMYNPYSTLYNLPQNKGILSIYYNCIFIQLTIN